ncbi:MAG: GNAT family N-acyltransferase, partial [Phycisphaerales bacterium]|nr:GNAT family N-acyltransferase [Phycisphaerales bacterium]
FLVDNFGSPEAPARNFSPMKAALQWLKEGHCLAMFPAGEVAHLEPGRRVVVDPKWNCSFARLARSAGAAIVPVYFDGRNSMVFQLAGLVHPGLRTILLARELQRRRHSTVRACVGRAIAPHRAARFRSAEALCSHVRLRTYLLASRLTGVNGPAAVRRPALLRPIVSPERTDDLEREISALPEVRQLVQSGDLAVYQASAEEIPFILREIGRLRELTFRAAGEGTGRERDLDRFDADYLHLFLWHRARRQLVGAYRMGLTDEILIRRGICGLYTSTLFRFEPTLLDRIGPAIELGRSFVRPECQRDYAPLLLLWRGIGSFVSAHPRYRMLLGPVSISNRYQSLSKLLLMRFLGKHNAPGELCKLVKARNPPRIGNFRQIELELSSAAVESVEEVDELLAEIESDRASMPVLLRQYLRLNARLLGFNVDPEFGEVLDGLMLVDLAQIDPSILTRYMGAASARAFLEYWRCRNRSAEPGRA